MSPLSLSPKKEAMAWKCAAFDGAIHIRDCAERVCSRGPIRDSLAKVTCSASLCLELFTEASALLLPIDARNQVKLQTAGATACLFLEACIGLAEFEPNGDQSVQAHHSHCVYYYLGTEKQELD